MTQVQSTSTPFLDLQNSQVIIEKFFCLEDTVKTIIVGSISLRVACPRTEGLRRQELAATLSLLMKVKRLFRKEMLSNKHRNRLLQIQSNELIIIFESLELAVKAITCETPNPELSRQLRVDAEMYLTKYEYSFFSRPFVNFFLFIHRSRSVAVKVIGGLIVSSSVVGAVTLGSVFTLKALSSESQYPIFQNVQSKSTGNSRSLFNLNEFKTVEPLFLLLIGGSAGAAGSIVSILLRIKDIVVIEEGDCIVDPILPIFLGLFKPVIGGALGIFTIALLNTKIISVGTIPDSGSRECLFFSIAFVVGFSERLAKDVIKKTEDLILSKTQVAIVATQTEESSSAESLELPSSANNQDNVKETNSNEAFTQATLKRV